MKHMKEQERCIIENMLNTGASLSKIAERLIRARSTIQREILKHRKEDEVSKKHKKNFCRHRKECFKKNLCKIPPQNCPGRCCQCKLVDCQQECVDYALDLCEKLIVPPFVCNGCTQINGCQKKKYLYTGFSAMKEYTETLHDCRKGIDVSTAEFREYNVLITQCGLQGQSIHHIMESNKDTFQKMQENNLQLFQSGIVFPASR